MWSCVVIVELHVCLGVYSPFVHVCFVMIIVIVVLWNNK